MPGRRAGLGGKKGRREREQTEFSRALTVRLIDRREPAVYCCAACIVTCSRTRHRYTHRPFVSEVFNDGPRDCGS